MFNRAKTLKCSLSRSYAMSAVGVQPMLLRVILMALFIAHADFAVAFVTADTSRCTVTYLSAVAPKNVTITSAGMVRATSALPEYCRMLASVNYPGNRIDFLNDFPTAWNEKFFWVAEGGLAGTPMTQVATAVTAVRLQAGYATGLTDSGHQGDPMYPGGTDKDPAFVYDINKFTDYGHRANKLTVDSAKALVAAYYQSPIRRALFNACSNGGRSAMINAQRYPGQFDGYIVGAPSISPTQMSLDWVHAQRAFFAKPSSFMPQAKLQVLGSAVRAACDADDGVKDGVLSNPLACKFDPRSLQCWGPDMASCLTKDQVDAVVLWNSDWKNDRGEVVSRRWLLSGVEDEPNGTALWQIGSNPAPVDASGVPYPNELQATGYAYMTGVLGDMVNGDHAYDVRKLDINNDLGFFAQVDGVVSAADTDLMAAARRGAKFIFYQGWGDPGLNPLNTIDYYNSVVARYGKKAADSFMRVFFVPGMAHCGAATLRATNQFDNMTAAMEQWLDTGIAPEQVIASKVVNGVVTRTRPLCAYPNYARYRPGAANAATFGIEDAYLFSCVDSTP